MNSSNQAEQTPRQRASKIDPDPGTSQEISQEELERAAEEDQAMKLYENGLEYC